MRKIAQRCAEKGSRQDARREIESIGENGCNLKRVMKREFKGKPIGSIH